MEMTGESSSEASEELKVSSAAHPFSSTPIHHHEHPVDGHAHGFHRLAKFSASPDLQHPILFLDLDNTLYPASTGIGQLMSTRITLYFSTFLGLPEEESASLGRRYYLDYGLAIRGLVSHFGIDPLHYDAFVDGGLPLESILHFDGDLVGLLRRCKARLFVFTNAGLQHALRVLCLLQVDSLFEGICYCDYTEPRFPAKPDRLAFERAERHAGISPNQRQSASQCDGSICYFADDAEVNVKSAVECGWKAVHVKEELTAAEENPKRPWPIARSIKQLPEVFPELFS